MQLTFDSVKSGLSCIAFGISGNVSQIVLVKVLRGQVSVGET